MGKKNSHFLFFMHYKKVECLNIKRNSLCVSQKVKILKYSYYIQWSGIKISNIKISENAAA